MQHSDLAPIATAPITSNDTIAGPRPVVVTLIGVPGAGKRSVAQALYEELGLRRIDREAIRDALFPYCTYSFAEKRAAFRGVLLALEINCLLGESSVIDGMTFARRPDLERVDQVIRQYGFLSVPVFLDCSTEVASARIAQEIALQPHLARMRRPAMVAEARARFDTPPPTALRVNADLALDDVGRTVVAAVEKLRVG